MRFEYGQSVRTKTSAPLDFHPGEVGSVCGMRTIEDEAVALTVKEPIGTALILVELSNGEAIEIPEKWLEELEQQ